MITIFSSYDNWSLIEGLTKSEIEPTYTNQSLKKSTLKKIIDKVKAARFYWLKNKITQINPTKTALPRKRGFIYQWNFPSSLQIKNYETSSYFNYWPLVLERHALSSISNAFYYVKTTSYTSTDIYNDNYKNGRVETFFYYEYFNDPSYNIFNPQVLIYPVRDLGSLLIKHDENLPLTSIVKSFHYSKEVLVLYQENKNIFLIHTNIDDTEKRKALNFYFRVLGLRQFETLNHIADLKFLIDYKIPKITGNKLFYTWLKNNKADIPAIIFQSNFKQRQTNNVLNYFPLLKNYTNSNWWQNPSRGVVHPGTIIIGHDRNEQVCEYCLYYGLFLDSKKINDWSQLNMVDDSETQVQVSCYNVIDHILEDKILFDKQDIDINHNFDGIFLKKNPNKQGIIYSSVLELKPEYLGHDFNKQRLLKLKDYFYWPDIQQFGILTGVSINFDKPGLVVTRWLHPDSQETESIALEFNYNFYPATEQTIRISYLKPQDWFYHPQVNIMAQVLEIDEQEIRVITSRGEKIYLNQSEKDKVNKIEANQTIKNETDLKDGQDNNQTLILRLQHILRSKLKKAKGKLDVKFYPTGKEEYESNQKEYCFSFLDPKIEKLRKKYDQLVSELEKIGCFMVETINMNRIHFQDGIPHFMKGLGFGRHLYLSLVKELGYASTRDNANMRAKSTWVSLIRDPELEVLVIGNGILTVHVTALDRYNPQYLADDFRDALIRHYTNDSCMDLEDYDDTDCGDGFDVDMSIHAASKWFKNVE